MSIDYKSLEFELYGLLLQIQEFLKEEEHQEEALAEIEARILQVKSKRYNVAVVGEFRRGKSSLINGLLGLSVLPADVTPTTATVNRITYGTVPSATIFYKDGSQKELEDINQLADYVTKITSQQEKMAAKVKEAVVYFPAVLCQNHVDIIDTPGLDDDEAMTAVTLNMLENIDAAIVTVSALSPFSETERHFVTRLIAHKGISTVAFVVTFIDQIDEDEYDRVFAGIKKRISSMTMKTVQEQYAQDPWVMEKAQRILGDMHIYGVSARKALNAFAANDHAMLEQSRFIPFKEELYKLLNSWQMVHMLEKGAQSATDILMKLGQSSASQEEEFQRKFQILEKEEKRIKEYIDSMDRFTDQLLRENAYELMRILTPDADKEKVFRDTYEAGRGDQVETWLLEDFRNRMRLLEERYALLDKKYEELGRTYFAEIEEGDFLEAEWKKWEERLKEELMERRRAEGSASLSQGEELIRKKAREITARGSSFGMRMGVNRLIVTLWQYNQEVARRMRKALFCAGGKKAAESFSVSFVQALQEKKRELEEEKRRFQEEAVEKQTEILQMQKQSASILQRIDQERETKNQEAKDSQREEG